MDWHPPREWVEAEALRFLLDVHQTPRDRPYTNGGPEGLWLMFSEFMADAAARHGPGTDWANSVRINSLEILPQVAAWIVAVIDDCGGFEGETELVLSEMPRN